MDKAPIQFWALMICALGAGLGLAALYAPGVDAQTRVMAYTLANSLVSGGLGAFTTSHIMTRTLIPSGNVNSGPKQ